MKQALQWIGAALVVGVGAWIIGYWNPIEIIRAATFDCAELRAETTIDSECLRSPKCMMTREEYRDFEERFYEQQKYCPEDAWLRPTDEPE